MWDYYFNMFFVLSAYTLGVLTSESDYNCTSNGEKAFTWVFAFVVGAFWPLVLVYCAYRMFKGK